MAEDMLGQLEELQRWTGDGSLERAATRQRLGEELDAVARVLQKEESSLARLDQLAAVADLVAQTDQNAASREAQRLVTAGEALGNADTPASLKAWREHQWPVVIGTSEKLLEGARSAWALRCTRAFDDHKKLGEVLERFPGTREIGQRVRGTARSGLELGKRFPPKAEDRAAFEQALAASEAERAELARGTEGVAELLLKVTKGNAKLSDLTEDTWKWLRQHGALDLFKLSL
ncbi:hypothetical protein F0U62_21390 [Cystobacter fuscus]|uniref:hypothetical protein n=1 Tax=Cystobacter fuscus TaxID=43 RepID=UPI002B2FB08B|nr:hypothetical protein F0U62_21390 [Cystobacter fuscus]